MLPIEGAPRMAEATEFRVFCRAVWKHAVEIVAGVAISIVGIAWQIIQWVYPQLQGPRFHPWMLVAMGLSLVFHASYLAWRDEYRKRVNAEATKQSEEPRFVTHIDGIGYAKKRDQRLLFVLVSIRNKGIPSIAEHWRVYLRGPNGLEQQIKKTQLDGEVVVGFPEGDLYAIDCERSDVVLNSAPKPVQTGELVRGFLFCYLNKTVLDPPHGWTVTVRYRDAWGNPHEGELTISPEQMQTRIDKYPGVAVRRLNTPTIQGMDD
jgi:hypothetical protein